MVVRVLFRATSLLKSIFVVHAAFRMSVIEKINQSGLRFSKTNPSIKAVDFPAITQISVSDIDDKKCKDALLHAYFSNRTKSSGGPVKKVDVIGRGRAIVSFEDNSSVGKLYCITYVLLHNICHCEYNILVKQLICNRSSVFMHWCQFYRPQTRSQGHYICYYHVNIL